MRVPRILFPVSLWLPAFSIDSRSTPLPQPTPFDVKEGPAPRFRTAIDRCYGEAQQPKARRERAQRSEPRERSEPAKRLARERVGESEGRSPSE
jgi:hypothetical protein